jgi:hypothetical protein
MPSRIAATFPALPGRTISIIASLAPQRNRSNLRMHWELFSQTMVGVCGTEKYKKSLRRSSEICLVGRLDPSVVQSAMMSIFRSKKFASHAYEITLGAETGKGNFGFLPPLD